MQDIMHERAWLHTSVDQVPITMRLFYCKVLHTVDKGPIPGAVSRNVGARTRATDDVTACVVTRCVDTRLVCLRLS